MTEHTAPTQGGDQPIADEPAHDDELRSGRLADRMDAEALAGTGGPTNASEQEGDRADEADDGAEHAGEV